MKGIIESVSYASRETREVDLFCGNCGDLIKIGYVLNGKKVFECPVCEERNTFSHDSDKRVLPRTFKKYEKKHPIVYWANKYGIPVNSCYIAFRKLGLGHYVRHDIGAPKKVTQREFLAGIVYTKEGRKIIYELIKKEYLLTDDTIHDSLA